MASTPQRPPHTPEIAALLPAYALGALDGEELALVEAHLTGGCPECDQELARWSGDLEALAASLPAVAPSELARARILRSLGETPSQPQARPVPESGRRRRLAWLPAAALIVALLWSGWSQMAARRTAGRLAAERDRLERQVAALDRELQVARGESRRLARAMEVLSAPGMKPVALAALGGRPGSGHTFVDPGSHRAVFVAGGLARPPAGRTYQLWFIAEGKPVSAGVFDVDAGGGARLEVEGVAPIDRIQAWAVTEEPAGGVPQPTGEMVLKG